MANLLDDAADQSQRSLAFGVARVYSIQLLRTCCWDEQEALWNAFMEALSYSSTGILRCQQARVKNLGIE